MDDIDLRPYQKVALEFCASERVVAATVVRRTKQALGFGWTFETKAGLVFVYEKDMIECAPVVLVKDGR